MNATFELRATFPAELESLTISAGLVALAISLAQIPIDVAAAVDLALSEAVTNAIKHTKPHIKDISLNIAVDSGEITLCVTDHGLGFAFDDVPDPDFDNHPPGGYGIFIIKESMDNVTYEKNETANILTMQKRFIPL
ncbi:ATP-binding protein [Desulfovibrio inopinatus]|uniref:ATP-binding protein n=1 Tax=Desulfovibrio inopinatus TaxID=102109 RepID=UPI0004279805|nr:ATP-binding protein [Desulfovibrio inopinatus]